MHIILASGSPRRKELLEREGIHFDIIPAVGDEVILGNNPAEIVRNLSRQKALEVAGRRAAQEKQRQKAGTACQKQIIGGTPDGQGGFIVIGADTVVSYDGKILGKPGSADEAAAMLNMLNGKIHQVYTGVTILRVKNGEMTEKVFHECTDVEFRQVSEKTILDYIATGEPMDKAGAYAIQGGWGPHVREIHGDYDNVVGLPVKRVLKELEELC